MTLVTTQALCSCEWAFNRAYCRFSLSSLLILSIFTLSVRTYPMTIKRHVTMYRPEVFKGKENMQLSSVLSHTSVSGLYESKRNLADLERVLDLGTDSGL